MITLKTQGPNAHAITLNDGRELLFSYDTLVGVQNDFGIFIQQNGIARSITTARHLKQWIGDRPFTVVSELGLQEQAVAQFIPLPF